jgi:hypothetical protein
MLDYCLSVFNLKYIVWANNGAHPATVALCRIQFEGHYITEIYKSVHKLINFEAIHAIIPNPAIII